MEYLKVVKGFYRELKKSDFYITKVLENFLKQGDYGKSILFEFVVEDTDGKMKCLFEEQPLNDNLSTGLVKERLHNIKIELLKKNGWESDKAISFLRCIGGTYLESGKEIRVYCFVALKKLPEIDSLYLKIIMKNYFRFISEYLRKAYNESAAFQRTFQAQMKGDIKRFVQQCSAVFQKYVKDIFDIDIDVVNGISGSYYEGDSCCSNLVFLFEEENYLKGLEGITLVESVEFSAKNIRKIRKLLQMGNAKLSLALCRGSSDNYWSVRGLYDLSCDEDSHDPDKDCVLSIRFQLFQHMVWKMDVNNKTTVCFKCMQYRIEDPKLDMLNLKSSFKKVFGQGQKLQGSLKNIFENALKQRHGTILVVLDKNEAEDEVGRLLRDSNGIGVGKTNLDGEYVLSATAIDGAMIVDNEGTCHGIGMILDSQIKLTGNSERGARYNSAMKYAADLKERKMKGLVVVVSEDQTIDVISTKDEFKEKQYDENKQ